MDEIRQMIDEHSVSNENVLLRMTPGTGKSYTTIQSLLKLKDKEVIIYSCYNKALKEEAYNNAVELSFLDDRYLYKFHSQKEVCQKKEEFNHIIGLGYSPAEFLCPSCPYRTTCPYKQERSIHGPGIYFVTHHMIPYLKYTIEKPDRIILDENLLNGFLLSDSCSEAEMKTLSRVLNNEQFAIIRELLTIAYHISIEICRKNKESMIINARPLSPHDHAEDTLLDILRIKHREWCTRRSEIDPLGIEKPVGN